MIWQVIFTEEFGAWYKNQSQSLQDDIFAGVRLLKEFGPNLSRPQVDSLKGSKLKNLKELRVQHKGQPYRVLFVFDPLRQAVFLVGGNKKGDDRWYEKSIKLAEKIYAKYLGEKK